MKKPIPKYHFLDNINDFLQKYHDDATLIELITNLKELILYQMIEIRDQRSEIIALKHQSAWKRYDKTI